MVTVVILVGGYVRVAHHPGLDPVQGTTAAVAGSWCFAMLVCPVADGACVVRQWWLRARRGARSGERRGDEAQDGLPGDREHRPGAARAVPGGDAQALLRRADPCRAERVREAPRQVADDARVRGRSRDDGPPADGDRALRLVERRQAPGRPRAAPVRDAARSCSTLLRDLGEELGRMPTAKDIEARQGRDAVQDALLAHLRVAQQRAQGGRLRRRRRRGAPRARHRPGRVAGDPSSAGCRSSPTGPRPASTDINMLTEWQVYRMFDARRGAWSTFQFLIRERLEDGGVPISPEGRLS